MEIDMFEDISESVNSEIFPKPTNEREWYVLHTKSRREKRIAETCEELDIFHYLPLKKKSYRKKGRTFHSDIPLFSGYLFVFIDSDERYRLLRTNNIANVLKVPDQEGLISDLVRIREALSMDAKLEPFRYLKKGKWVKIVGGPFKGLEGIISRRKGKYKLVLNVDFIHRSVATEIDLEYVKPLN